MADILNTYPLMATGVGRQRFEQEHTHVGQQKPSRHVRQSNESFFYFREGIGAAFSLTCAYCVLVIGCPDSY